ncbi:MAG: hypothetical protein JW702_08695 [Clostridiales bacterium]|nr:hypothetical protein [Clostridiales bacterium]
MMLKKDASQLQVIDSKHSSENKNSIKLVGYSDKINDPAFKKYLKNSNRWSGIFSIILGIVAIIGFYIYGESSNEMDNPQALFIGFGIAGMFISIAMIQIIGRKRSKTWDGIVIDKKIKKKNRKSKDGYASSYIQYKVLIKKNNGKEHEIIVEDDDTIYNYYQIGNVVRHHAGLNTFEKYDKSKDEIIFCNACASLNDIEEDYCFRCHCPLLK